MAAIDKSKIKSADAQWERFMGIELFTVTLNNGRVYKNLAKLPNGNYTHPVLI
jgi:hypothetical protein